MPATPSPSPDAGLTIITTHVNADFDAMASMLAAQKLYPGAMVVFPGSQEKNLRNFFIQSMVYMYNLAEIKDIDLQQVKRLVLVDTRKAERIGVLAGVLHNPELEIHVYDHHPIKEGDITGVVDVHRVTGATATLMTEILRQRKMPLNAEEATIICLGIYEDTGAFTFSSTTAEDLRAAAYLVSQGANINVIANLIAREISPTQIGYLNDLIQAATRYMINGIEIVVSTVTYDHYLPDFAFLVHKMVKMEELNAIFAIAQMESKVYIVARSRTESVDVGEILTALGGGGHPSAAAATIRGQTLAQVEQALFRELHRQIVGMRQARHLMSSPPITADAAVTCVEANNLLTRYNINALLVTIQKQRRSELVGYITRQVIEKIIYHHLGDVPIGDYMSTEWVTVDPDADLSEVQEKIIGHKQRILPVMRGKEILGVISRTDLLTMLVQSQTRDKDAGDAFRRSASRRTRNITHFMQERLSTRVLDILRDMGRVAESLGYGAYVVGGFVRDLFLYRPNEDIDIVIEGDGIAFAKAYALEFGTRIHTHKAFGTAVVIYPDGFKIDVATARLEYYRSPAALPDVEMSSIKLDLFRRDFTINTLAIQLIPDKFGRLLDFFSAQKDIKDKAIRVLHNLSFVEDPTRVFRALRFEQRFGFTIGKLTAALIDNAVKMDFFKRLSGRRVFTEIRLILEEDNPVPAIVRMGDFDLLKVIHPTIVINKALIALLEEVRGVIAWHDLLFVETPCMRWTVYLMGLIHANDMATCHEICRRLELATRYEALFCQERAAADHCLQQMEHRLPASAGALYHRLHPFRAELILYMMAATRVKAVKKAISKYYTELRKIEPLIGGNELIALGLTPGPLFRQILDAILDAKLNGALATREDEIQFARRWAADAAATASQNTDDKQMS
ncbi:CBS domain-containing protein [Desulfatitalea alkaliphila]|uniref:CBS domain-containing protein n=1 Tax=Desulfatitalea alkaliphila TaxID=2929485 RepID=A0AA41R1I7_9BACT|nr:CBS domain-containing protein [Desulfatitalea alkaliphila]MCJ8500764.1 CBS domain-containing protein [Desulfatitalea alkaliphila]